MRSRSTANTIKAAADTSARPIKPNSDFFSPVCGKACFSNLLALSVEFLAAVLTNLADSRLFSLLVFWLTGAIVLAVFGWAGVQAP
ncbi:hypothetical protein FD39_GL000381 [Lactobacillus amylolyticus DSM 11664]|nr:hypothetical protein FD39_GL000381 [Lactobacillus amylolyticus DSM 11664]